LALLLSNTSVPDTLRVSGGGNLSTSATSIYAGTGAPAGYPTSFPWILQIEPGTANFEMVLVISGAGTSASPWIITRAADGTTAKTHTSGVAIAHTMSATDLTTAASHYAAGSSGTPVHNLPAAAWLTGAFQTFFELTTTAAQASLTFTPIPQTAQHLLITASGRLAETTALADDVSIQFNGDSGAHYSYMSQSSLFSGTLQQPAALSGYALTSAPLFRLTASQGGAAANVGGGFALIPNYTSASFNKMAYCLSGGGDGTSSFIDMRTRIACWNPAAQAAITSIGLIAPTGGFNLNCQLCLYGLG
jgi:hypothetical protein